MQTNIRGNSFALGRRVIKKHVDEIEVNIKELEAGVGDASRQLQQSKDAKQHLKKEESQLSSAMQRVKETKMSCIKRIDDCAPIFTDRLSESILNADGITVLRLIESRDKELQLEQDVWQVKQKLVPVSAQVSKLTEKKRKLKSELNKLEAECETAKSLMNQLQELIPQKCVVCLDKAATHAVVPCGHRALCMPCGGKFQVGQKCPVCRQAVEDVRQIFFECPARIEPITLN